MIATILAMLLTAAVPPAATGAANPEQAIAAIDSLRLRLGTEPTEAGQRQVANELLAARRALVQAYPEDPRQALWMGDYAEDCFTLALPAGGDVDRVLYGIAGADARRRVRDIVSDMLGVAEEAERRAKATLALPPERSVPRDVADRLAHVERPRRIPLLRALAGVLQVEVGEFEPGRRRSLAEAAIARVETLLPELDDRTASVVARYAGLAAARIEDERAASRLLRLAKERAGEEEALVTLADLATLRAAGLLRGPRSAVEAAGAIRGSGTPARRMAMAELEARLRRQHEAELRAGGDGSSAGPWPAWTVPFTGLMALGTPAEAATIRDAAIARLVEIRTAGVPMPQPEAMALLAESQALLDTDGDVTPLRLDLEKLASDEAAPPAARAGALRSLARMDMAKQAWAEAADRFLQLASGHPDDPAAGPAMGVAVRLAREVDRAADGQDPAARSRAERCVAMAIARFPSHADLPVWALDRKALALEAQAEGRSCEAGPEPSAAQAPPEDRGVAWLRDRAAAAEACIRMAAGDATGAMAAMEARPGLPEGRVGTRRLAARVAALAELDRDLAADQEVRAALDAQAATVVSAASDRLLRLLPSSRLPIEPAKSPTVDAAAARRLAEVLAAGGCRDAATWIDAGDLLRLRGEPRLALQAYERALSIQPDAREALLGKAESLRIDGGAESLAAAMAIHRRLLSGRDLEPDASRRDHAWWLGQLRQLQILEQSGRFDDRARMRLNRLRAVDPALGGPAFALAFEALPTPPAP